MMADEQFDEAKAVADYHQWIQDYFYTDAPGVKFDGPFTNGGSDSGIRPAKEMEVGKMHFQDNSLCQDYISANPGRYAGISHVGYLCPCGCRKAFHLPIESPCNKGWGLTIHEDSTVSLNPSIQALGDTCKSHYFIHNGMVQWA